MFGFAIEVVYIIVTICEFVLFGYYLFRTYLDKNITFTYLLTCFFFFKIPFLILPFIASRNCLNTNSFYLHKRKKLTIFLALIYLVVYFSVLLYNNSLLVLDDIMIASVTSTLVCSILFALVYIITNRKILLK